MLNVRVKEIIEGHQPRPLAPDKKKKVQEILAQATEDGAEGSGQESHGDYVECAIISGKGGTGKTTVTASMAAMAAGRHSISMEIDTELANPMASNLSEIIEPANQRIEKRLADHRDFIKRYKEDGREPKHFNTHHDVPVVTSQETELKLQYLTEIVRDTETSLTARYGDERPILLPLFQDG